MSLSTRITRGATTALLVGATVAGTALATAGAADAATPGGGYWAAIAVSQRTGSVGYGYDYPTVEAAKSAAVQRCGRSDCRVAVYVINGCVALAQARNGAWGTAWSGSRAGAERIAVQHTAGSGARVIGWACTTGHQ
ncbi:DUF4189 domain-containing protein [Pseudonocardia sp. CA-107938]|uniref:DUF4189 domain-containing protein n=1 Tax=Pseudonocardia sp. CA-107938 TaxID=3240021 RepID=UPI003D8B9240